MSLADDGHVNGSVGNGAKQAGIRHGQQRRRIDDDEISTLAQLGQEILHPLGTKKLGRVRGNTPSSQHLKTLGLGSHQGVIQTHIARKYLGESDARFCTEGLVLHRTAHIGINEDDLLAGLCHDDGEVCRNGRLSFTRVGRGDHDSARRIVDVGEPQVGAKLTESLTRDTGDVHDRLLALLGKLLVIRNHTEDPGPSEFLDSGLIPNLDVELFADHRNDRTDEETDHQTGSDV